jgi:superfamily II DNA or RNA helicase
MSDMRFCQNIGRGLRNSPGKTDLLILDHSTTTMRLGMVDEIYGLHNSLDDGKTKAQQKMAMLLPKECEACHYLKPPRTAKCPNCGHVQEKHVAQVAVERGTLREIKADTERASLLRKLPEKPWVYGQLWWWGQRKGCTTTAQAAVRRPKKLTAATRRRQALISRQNRHSEGAGLNFAFDQRVGG